MTDIEKKQQVIEAVQKFSIQGLGVGTSGNLSVRSQRGFFITPSGVPYHELKPDLLVELDSSGDVISGDLLPSSEWRFHKDIYLSHEKANAIVHVHSPYATAISCTRKDIPSFHYMVAVAGGNSIRCADYATFGTAELSDNAVHALQDRKACLLANHGVIALGKDVNSAFNLAVEVEELSKQYYFSLQIGEPVLLDEKEMDIILEKFKTYGKQNEPE